MANVNNIDSRILAYPDTVRDEEERRVARELRENKNRARNGVEEAAPEEDNLSLRQRVFALKKAMKKKEDKEEGLKAKVLSPIKMATNQLLKRAWMTLIPSWGFSLIYINMHIFLRWVFPDLFCKLGDEWKPKIVGEHSSKNIAGTAFGLAEVIGLFFLDLIAIAFIFSFLTIVVMIVDFLSANWLEKGFMLLGLGWEGIRALVNLFFITAG